MNFRVIALAFAFPVVGAACVGDSPLPLPDAGDAGGDAITSGDVTGVDGPAEGGGGPFNITLATKLTPSAQGSVSIAPAGTSCGANCYTYAAGTSVTVTASPIGPNDFQAWLGACTGFTTACTFNVTSSGTVTGWFRPRLNYMFVSSKKYAVSTLGTGGTLKNADDACDALAQAASLTGATGTYRAWLATASTPACARFVNKRTWIRVDGKLFGDLATEFGGLGDGSYTAPSKVYYPPRLDENGNDLVNDADTKVATGQLDSGEPNSNCADWTSTAGIAYAGDLTTGTGVWAGDFNSVQCNASARIYCFEILQNVAATLPTPSGHMAFVTKGMYTTSTGLAAADSLCQSEATSAQLLSPTTFKALLSTATQSAFARLGTTTTGPWVRPDGIQIVVNPADLGTGTLIAPIDVTASKTYLESVGVWTGGNTAPNTVAASAQDACTNWTATGGSGVDGNACSSKPSFFHSSSVTCTTAQHIYCAQP